MRFSNTAIFWAALTYNSAGYPIDISTAVESTNSIFFDESSVFIARNAEARPRKNSRLPAIPRSRGFSSFWRKPEPG